MIGLTGAVVALLCTAYFALIVSALWEDEPAGDAPNVPVGLTGEPASRMHGARARHADPTRSGARRRSVRCGRRHVRDRPTHSEMSIPS